VETNLDRISYYGISEDCLSHNGVRFFVGLRQLPLPIRPPWRESRKHCRRRDRPVIATFGDSLSAGFGVEAGKSYPDFL
jgi:hypothetical protein